MGQFWVCKVLTFTRICPDAKLKLSFVQWVHSWQGHFLIDTIRLPVFDLVEFFQIGIGSIQSSLIQLGLSCFLLANYLQTVDGFGGLQKFVLNGEESLNKHEEKMNGDGVLCLQSHSWSSQ